MRGTHFKPGPLALVMATVILQLAAAWILGNVASTSPRPGLMIAATAVSAALVLSFFRFVIWGYAHRRYPISSTYPLTALFFPGILVLSYARGDAIGLTEIIGTLLITVGAFTLAPPKQDRDHDHA